MSSIELKSTSQRPCAQCGATERYNGGGCKACAKIAGQRWRAANPEKVKARHLSEAAKAHSRAWQGANREKTRAGAAAWRAANPQELRVHQQNDRARKCGAEGELSRGLVGRLLESQQGICPCCSAPLGEDFQIDHLISLHNGGSNTDSNVHLLRALCNASKGPRNFDVFMRSKGTV